MSDFRKLLLAFAVVTLTAGLANAQATPPIVCTTSANPLTVRTEGLSELTGDVVMRCQGGSILPAGATIPQVNISVTLTTNITSRFVDDGRDGPETEALLFIDDPAPGTQNPCTGSGTVCTPLYSNGNHGAVTSPTGTGTPINVFQGVRQNDNTIVFLAVPISAPGSQLTRVLRIRNIRAAVAGASAPQGQIFAFVSIQNPPANLQVDAATVQVAFVQQGLSFTRRSNTGGSFDANTSRTKLFICNDVNQDMAGNLLEDYNTGSDDGRHWEIRYTEGYAASFKPRDIRGPLEQTNPTAQQDSPTTNYDTESGHFNTAYPAINGLHRAGRADHGTRLRVVFNNVPANMRLFVSAHALSSAAVTTGSTWRGGGETSSGVAAFGVSTDSNGANVAAGTVLANPTSPAERGLGGNVAGYPAGVGEGGAIEVPLVGGSGQFTWEIFAANPLAIDTVSFAVALAFNDANNPGTGTVTQNGMFAPVSTVRTMSGIAPIPRFSDTSTASNGASINACVTNLLFPFVTNQGGFDTGIAISNTSADPFGTAPQSGTCKLNYYGQTTGGGAAPSAQTTTSPIAGGQTLVATLSSGGTNGIAATPGFQGYIIAQCNFLYGHGFAFISDVGAQKLAQGYVALILDASGVNRTGLTGEALGQ